MSRRDRSAVLSAVEFTADEGKRKENWRNNFRDRLTELTVQVAALPDATLAPAIVRHPAYAATTLESPTREMGAGWRRLQISDGVSDWPVPFATAAFGAAAFGCSSLAVGTSAHHPRLHRHISTACSLLASLISSCITIFCSAWHFKKESVG